MARVSHLKDMPPEQLAQRASQYYKRARKAEDELAAANKKIAALESRLNRIHNAAQAIVDSA